MQRKAELARAWPAAYTITVTALLRTAAAPVFAHPKNWPKRIWQCPASPYDRASRVVEEFLARPGRCDYNEKCWLIDQIKKAIEGDRHDQENIRVRIEHGGAARQGRGVGGQAETRRD
jgi:hypothetical protein